jgi:hypothetical protein
MTSKGILLHSVRRFAAGIRIMFYLNTFVAVRAMLCAQLYSNVGGNEWSDTNSPGEIGRIVFCEFVLLGNHNEIVDQLKALLDCIIRSLVETGDLTLAEARGLASQIDSFAEWITAQNGIQR